MKILLIAICLLMMTTPTSWAIDVRPVDDYSAYCDDKDCIVSHKYLHDLNMRIRTQQETINVLFLENRDIRQKTSVGESIPYDVQSKEWSQRVSRELHIINGALSKRIMILEKSCPN